MTFLKTKVKSLSIEKGEKITITLSQWKILRDFTDIM